MSGFSLLFLSYKPVLEFRFLYPEYEENTVFIRARYQAPIGTYPYFPISVLPWAARYRLCKRLELALVYYF
jgi:hypothetical protein